MKAGMDLNALAAEITRQAEASRDFKSPTTELTVSVLAHEENPTPKLQINGHGKFDMTPLMHDQIGSYTGIPAKYYDRMLAEKPELLADNVNSWLHDKKETRLVRTLDGNARAFLSNRYRTIDNVQVAEAVLPIFAEIGPKLGLRVESSMVTDTRLYIKAVTPKLEAVITRERAAAIARTGSTHGDRPSQIAGEEIVVQSGIVISNSEVGLHSFKIEPLLFILACYNGAIIPGAGMKRYHIGRHTEEQEQAIEVFADDTRQADDRALLLKMRDVVRASFDEVQFRQLAEHLTITTANKIEGDLTKVVEKTVEVYSLPEVASGSILKHLAGGADLTQWGLSNAITAYAQDDKLNYEQATELERVGGDVLMLEPQKWEALAQAA